MIWLTWRQYRIEILIMGIILLVLATVLLATGINIATESQKIGIGTCMSQHTDCTEARGILGNYISTIVGSSAFYFSCIALPLVLPVLAGMFIGAHIIARELDQGTYRLIWTQGIPWYRWLLARIGLITGIVLLAFGILFGLFSWWSFPLSGALQESGNFGFSNRFDGWGIATIAYALFALMLGIFAGTALRKTVPAMAITLVIFVAVRVLIVNLWRPYFLPPVVLTTPAILTASGQATQIPDNSWILSYGTVDRQGQQITINDPDIVCGALLGSKATDADVAQYNRCIEDHGFQIRAVYQPADRFWPLQGIESSIYLFLAAVLFALTFWWTKYRIIGK